MPIPEIGKVYVVLEHKMKDVIPERRMPRNFAVREEPEIPDVPPDEWPAIKPEKVKKVKVVVERVKREYPTPRTQAIIEDLRSGTFTHDTDIARKHKCSRQRVQQIKKQYLS